ncbi:hypothetical protein DFH06DRAFT_601618 [Mycena polygramma]|nr:hypothetical protein DFH06DRAFT_601618 [Mycena polygramma]
MLENDEDFDDQTALCDSQDSLPSDDGRPCAFNAAIALLWSDDARTSLSGMVVSKIIVMLEDEQHIIRQLDALSAIATSVQYPDIREAICSRSKSENSTSIIYNTLSLLRHENADIRRNAYDVVLALVVYDDSHALLFSGETFFEVASLLRDDSLPSMYELRSHHDCDTFICEMIPAVVSKLQDGPGTKTLAALILIMQTAQGGEAISPDLMSQIGSLLADPKWRIERHTLRCFIDLMQYDKLRPYFPFSQTAARILPLLRSARWTEIEGLLTYLSYGCSLYCSTRPTGIRTPS